MITGASMRRRQSGFVPAAASIKGAGGPALAVLPDHVGARAAKGGPRVARRQGVVNLDTRRGSHAVRSDRRWRSKKATARTVRLLASPVLPVAADLHFPERHQFVQILDVISGGLFLDIVARKLGAIIDTAAMR